LAAAKNVGFAYGFNVHNEDEDPINEFGRGDTTDFTEAGHLVRDVIYGSNFTASHLVHFYHLAALDFVDASNAGAASLDKSPACPRYGPQPGDPLYPYYYRIPAVLNTYLVAQYVLALKFRRLCNQIGGLWGGRAPFVQGLTPGGATPSVTQDKIDKTRELLFEGGVGGTPSAPAPGTILKFIGTPFDFANWLGAGADPGKLPIIGDGTYGGTMMFDVVAVAMYYPEYFWMGNAYERFLAYGVFEKGDPANAVGDNRLLSRGRKRTGARYSNQIGVLPADFGGAPPAEWLPATQGNVYESIKHSHYVYPAGSAWRHPLQGETQPEPAKDETYGAYSWVKSPRYKDASDPVFTSGAVPYEAGPLARMQVNGDYYGGILYDLGYTAGPALPWTGPGTFPLAGAKVPQYGDPGPDLGAALSTLPGYFPDLSGITYNGDSALDRYAARQVECWKVANAIVGWLDRLEADHIGGVTSKTRVPYQEGGQDRFYTSSYGWTEAPRGALGHWMKATPNGGIEKYQCVVPSTWNASPQDAFDVHGPAERAMMNTWTKAADTPLEILRVSHAWDFCTACAVHLVSKDGKKKEEHTFTFNPAPTGG
jgi:hydrogenase large subunit